MISAGSMPCSSSSRRTTGDRIRSPHFPLPSLAAAAGAGAGAARGRRRRRLRAAPRRGRRGAVPRAAGAGAGARLRRRAAAVRRGRRRPASARVRRGGRRRSRGAGAAAGAAAPSLTTASTVPTSTVSPSWHADLGQRPRRGRRHLGVDLVGRDLEERLVARDGLAHRLQPLGDGALGDGLAELGHRDVSQRAAPFR